MAIIQANFIRNFRLFATPRMIIVFLLGFSAGLPSELTRTALQAWYTVSGISIVSIGLLGLVSLPYVYKFLWAPVMDCYLPPLLGRRTGWLLLCQAGLVITIIAMACCSPRVNPLLLAGFAVLTAFFSASQDIVVDAYRTDLLSPSERAPGTALNVAGYRIAMLVSGGLSLIMAAVLGWQVTYIIMALLMGIGIIATWFGPEPLYQQQSPTSIKLAIIEPFREFLTRNNAIALLSFIILYKISYACILNMSPTFLLRILHFSLLDVGAVNKGIGLVATLLGVFIGGVYTVRLGLFQALFCFGLLQALGNLTFVWLAIIGKSYTVMMLAIFLVNLFAGMETAAFVTLLMSLCDHRYTATQYALLSACAMLANSLVAPVAGFLIQAVGWVNFYLWTVVIAVPGLVVLCLIRKNISPVKKIEEAPLEGAF